MQAILDFCTAILDFFSLQFKSVAQLIRILPDMFSGVLNSFAYAPEFLFPFLSISVSLTLLFAVLRLL